MMGVVDMPNTGGFWFTPLELLEKIKEVDGVGSGLDADYLRGKTFEDRLKSAYQAYSLLGSIGYFEVDSDADGVADGWSLTEHLSTGSCTPSLVEDATQGTYCQKLYAYDFNYNGYSDLTTSDYHAIDTTFPLIFSGDFKIVYTSGSGYKIYLYIIYYDSSYNNIGQENMIINATSEYKRFYKELNIPADAAYLKVRIRIQYAATGGARANIFIDNLRIVGIKDIDFTNALVQQFFGSSVTSVNDLITPSNITNRFGVTKTGYDWILYLAGYGEGVYTRYFGINVDTLYEG